MLFVCLFHGLGALGLVGPDEPRYAAIARSMAETGDWVTPKLWGSPWLEKPILYYWTAASAMRLFGATEFAARFPSALAALLAVFAAAWASLRCYGARAAWCVLLMLPASVAMIGFARGAGPDMLFAATLTAAMAAAMEILQTPRPGWLARCLFGFFAGAAVLAKGPAAVILAAGALALWALAAGRMDGLWRFLHPLVILAWSVTALPWYILCALRNPDFLRIFIWEHNFQRFLTPVFEHRQPFWFFAVILLLAMLPWTWICLVSLDRWRDRGRQREQQAGSWRDSPDLFLSCWAGFIVVFFSISQSKLPGYILPAIPALFALIGRQVAWADENGRPMLRWAVVATGAMFLLAAVRVARPVLALVTPWDSPAFLGMLGAATAGLLGGVTLLWLGWRKHLLPSVVTVSALAAILVLIFNLGIVPVADHVVSSRSVARDVIARAQSGQAVFHYKLPRAWGYGLEYYGGGPAQQWNTDRAGPAWIVTTVQAAQQLREAGIEIREARREQGSPIMILRVGPEK